MSATVVDSVALGQMVLIHITNDPFPTYVDRAQLQRVSNTKERNMPSEDTALDEMNPRQLRQEARERGLKNWEVMDADELLAALKETSPPRKKSRSSRGSTSTEAESASDNNKGEEASMPTKRTTKTSAPKKAPAKKAAPSKRAPAKAAPAKAAATKSTGRRAAPTPPAEYEGPNPFRPGSNLFKITEVLLVGGKNKDLVKKLAKQLEYKPRVKSTDDFDVDAETDRRMKIVGYILRNEHGFEYIYDTSNGRGDNAFIKVVPPKS